MEDCEEDHPQDREEDGWMEHHMGEDSEVKEKEIEGKKEEDKKRSKRRR